MLVGLWLVSQEISGKKFPEICYITYVNQLFPSAALQSDAVN